MKRTYKIAAVMMALAMILMLLPFAPAQASNGNTYVLDTTADLEAMSASAENDGKELVVNDYFTIILGEKTKIDSSNKEFEDGYTAAQRLNFQHKSKSDENGVVKPAVKFTTSASATIKLWWVSGGEGRQMVIFNDKGDVVAKTEVSAPSNEKVISELTVEGAGTYYLGTPDGSNYLFKMEVAEDAGVPETTAPAVPETTAPAVPETTAPAVPEAGEDVDQTGDLTFLATAAMIASSLGLVVLARKKEQF